MRINGRQLTGTVMIAAGMMFIAAALILFLHNSSESRNSLKKTEELLPLIHQVIEERRADTDKNTSVNEPTAVIGGNEYIGILEIPSAGLEMPVFSRWSYDNLEISPCRYYGSAEKDNLVIAGHNYSSGFGQLENLSRGENIYFTDMNGMTYSYAVDDIEILEPGDVLPMIDGTHGLSLYTCTYSGKQRLTVRCGRTEIKNG